MAFTAISAIVPIVLLFFVGKVQGSVEFTNINCTSLDTDFLVFDQCLLKSVNRTYKYLTVKTKIHKFPLDDIQINLAVLKRLNGYKPFLFNFTADACKFLGGKQNQLQRYFYSIISPYTNVVHKCPYDHDLSVSKLPISHVNHMLTNVLPVPEGEYCLYLTYFNCKIARAELRVFLKIY